MTPDVLARFLGKVEPEPNSGCWLWTAAEDGHGYGVLGVRRRPQRAHRLSYEHHKGPIPPRHDVDHLCRVTLCVNPIHLEAVTRQEHAKRNIRYHRATCPAGHPYAGDNLYTAPDGSRYCRACRRRDMKALFARRRTGPTVPNGTKTHCKHGHPFAGTNLYIDPTTGGRVCRACRNRSAARCAARKKMEATADAR